MNTNQKYKFRIINGGQHASLRFSVDGFPLTVVAVDSQPIEPYSVDQVFFMLVNDLMLKSSFLVI